MDRYHTCEEPGTNVVGPIYDVPGFIINEAVL